MASDGFRFPPPYSGQNFPRESAPHFMTSEGMLMPSHMQPPPMYGPRGATIAPKFLGNYSKNVQPRKSDFYCESCDRSFKSETDLDSHKSEHQRCGIDGCSFVGHPVIVTKHIEQQHSSGLYDKLKNLSTPEDIAKWREERKKRYPSRANVELRQQIQEEKQKRGERLQDRKSRFGQKDDRRKMPGKDGEEPRTRNTKNQRKRRRKYENSNRAIEKTAVIVDEEDNASDSKIRKFEGTSGLSDYERSKAKKTVENALTSLVGMYGSDDDSTSEDESEVVSKSPSAEDLSCKKSSEEIMAPTIHKEIIEKPNRPDEQEEEANTLPEEEDLPLAEPSDDDEENQQEEVPFEKVVESFPETEDQSVPESEELSIPDNDTKLNSSKKRVRIRRKPEGTCPPKPTTALNYSKLYRRRQNTMLEKLLQPDIIHERNVLLQCVRYVVQKNFFGVGQPKEEKT